MENKLLTTVNGTNLETVKHEGEFYVPVKPLCQAIGIDFAAQRAKINEHEILGSVVVLSTTTGADGKSYEMFCLPVKYVYGWLFTINPANVAPAARESVIKYRRECYEVLYRHFSGSMRRHIEENEAEIRALEKINAALSREKEARADRRKAEDELARIRAARLDASPALPLD